jgi:DNA mismatch repair protein MutS2
MKEREEVERILRELTAVLASEAGAIEETFHTLAELDGIYARARFGMEYQAVVPGLSGEGRLSLRAARHPLLLVKSRLQPRHDDVVPNMIALEPGQRALILSGPNAGGKTAVLKTVGLLCLMAQAGIPVPAAEGSEVPCFTSVFADIGDEQSLEQDLSTYSAHVRQIAEILSRADGDSLVLLDELGAGTEPGEGAGLGSAVLESLIERGSLTIATTHHNAIKLFGSKTTGAVNAAMEFDPQTLKPTYRLLPGRPGRSYGLEMAARMGVPRAVIDRAWAAVDEDSASLDQLLKQVERDSRVIAEERQRLERDLQDARRDRENAAALLRTAREEAYAVKSRAKTDAASILSALKQKLKDLSRIAATDRTELAQARSEVQALRSRLEPEPQMEYREGPGQRQELHVGDSVRIKGLNKTGIVIMVQGEIVEIEVGAKTIKLPAADVEPAISSRKAPAVSVPGWSAELQQEEDTPTTVNIIGLRVPEALAEVERFVDRAGVHHISVVTIIHGLGTGALKTAVTEYLKNHPLVASMRQGEPAEGGAGVTVAELKK